MDLVVVDNDSQLYANANLGEDHRAPAENESTKLGLHGRVPCRTHRSISRLAASFGFISDAAMKGWIDSEAFSPFYAALQANLQKYGSTEKVRNLSQKPRLTNVQKALVRGEQKGVRKFSRRSEPDLENFRDAEFYALFLFLVVDYNSKEREGAFFGENMTTEDMQARVWEAMLRANHEETRYRGARKG
ncbi:hypothetical protein V493_03477 [Pseudogymnoascus sp. VKM F-4281 (FW-2241)]|nr:hypothetical protein V493_03477 [Pseudogymnoascus sp. VKM F-4281 (FW-2241)]